VICLDALRALGRSPEAFAALAAEVAAARDPRLDRKLDEARRLLADAAGAERNARRILERLALCVQASLMKRFADAQAAEAFVDSRLGASGERAFGTLGLDGGQLAALVERAGLQGT